MRAAGVPPDAVAVVEQWCDAGLALRAFFTNAEVAADFHRRLCALGMNAELVRFA